VPLSNIQIDILQEIASHRDPESYVAGDREERVAAAALTDAKALAAAGYGVSWLRQLPLISRRK
jgi:hypothetical protein